jgi:hypothetical protein
MRAEFQDCHFGTVAKSIIAAAFGRQDSTKRLDLTMGLFLVLTWCGGKGHMLQTVCASLAPPNIMYNTCIVEHFTVYSQSMCSYFRINEQNALQVQCETPHRESIRHARSLAASQPSNSR